MEQLLGDRSCSLSLPVSLLPSFLPTCLYAPIQPHHALALPQHDPRITARELWMQPVKP